MKLIKSVNEEYTIRQLFRGEYKKEKPIIHLSHVSDYDSLKMIKDAMNVVLKYQLGIKDEYDRKKFLHYLSQEMGDSVDGQRFLRILRKYFNVVIEK